MGWTILLGVVAMFVIGLVVTGVTARRRWPRWRPHLDGEIARWRAMSFGDVEAELAAGLVAYERDGFQYEIRVMERRSGGVFVDLTVFDHSLSGFMHPLGEMFWIP